MKSVKKTLKKYFIPHAENNHKPHFLRAKAVSVMALVVAILFVASMAGSYVVSHNTYLASIKAAFLVDLTNEDRAEAGVPKLTINETLVSAAKMKAGDMSAKSYFAHVSPEGRSPWYWIQQAGYKYVYAGENLAVNFTSSEDVEKAWMDSPTHKKNIMNSKFSEIGIATASGTYKGDSTIYVVQMFGTPMPKNVTEVRTPAAAPAPTAPVRSTATTSTQVSLVTEPENVLGEEVEAAPATTTELAASSESESTETYVEFANPDLAPEEIEVFAINPSATENPAPVYTNWFQRLIVSPSEVVQDLYMALAALIIFALILKIFIEIRRQHPKNIAYGVLLLALVIFFMHLNKDMAEPILALI